VLLLLLHILLWSGITAGKRGAVLDAGRRIRTEILGSNVSVRSRVFCTHREEAFPSGSRSEEPTSRLGLDKRTASMQVSCCEVRKDTQCRIQN